jgi:hypothetical protein
VQKRQGRLWIVLPTVSPKCSHSHSGAPSANACDPGLERPRHLNLRDGWHALRLSASTPALGTPFFALIDRSAHRRVDGACGSSSERLGIGWPKDSSAIDFEVVDDDRNVAPDPRVVRVSR